MNGQLTKYSTFQEIETFFILNDEILPKTLDGECKYYPDVKFTVNLYIYQVNSEIKRLGIKEVRKSAVALAAKGNLYTLYVDLCNVDGWDKPLPKIKKFQNRMY